MKGLLWVFFEKIGLTLLSLIATFWYAVILGPEGFGFAAILLSISLLISGIQDSIQQSPLIASVNDNELVISTSLKGWLIVSLLLSSILFFTLIYIYSFQFWLLILLSVLHIPISSLSGVFVADLIKMQAYKQLALRAFLGKLLGVISGLLLAYLGFVKLAIILQSFVSLFVSLLVMVRTSELLPILKNKMFESIDWSLFKSLFIEGIPSGFNVLEQGAKSHGLIIFLGIFIGPSASGLYSLAIKFIDIPRVLIGYGFSSWAMGKFYSVKDDKDKLYSVFETASLCSMIILVPSYMGMIPVSGFLIADFFGPNWSGASLILSWLAAYHCILSVFLFLPPLQVLFKTTYNTLFFNVASTLIILISVILLPDYFDVYSPLVGMFLSLMFVVPKLCFELANALQISIISILRNIIGCVISGLMMSIFVYLFIRYFEINNLYILILIGVVTYSVLLIAFTFAKCIDFNVINRIRSI